LAGDEQNVDPMIEWQLKGHAGTASEELRAFASPGTPKGVIFLRQPRFRLVAFVAPVRGT